MDPRERIKQFWGTFTAVEMDDVPEEVFEALEDALSDAVEAICAEAGCEADKKSAGKPKCRWCGSVM